MVSVHLGGLFRAHIRCFWGVLDLFWTYLDVYVGYLRVLRSIFGHFWLFWPILGVFGPISDPRFLNIRYLGLYLRHICGLVCVVLYCVPMPVWPYLEGQI